LHGDAACTHHAVAIPEVARDVGTRRSVGYNTDVAVAAGRRCVAVPPPLAVLLVASAVPPGDAAVGVRLGGLHTLPAALFTKPRRQDMSLDESGEVRLGHVHRLHGQGYALRGSGGGREGRAPLLPTAGLVVAAGGGAAAGDAAAAAAAAAGDAAYVYVHLHGLLLLLLILLLLVVLFFLVVRGGVGGHDDTRRRVRRSSGSLRCHLTLLRVLWWCGVVVGGSVWAE